jgi:hypothetical protein
MEAGEARAKPRQRFPLPSFRNGAQPTLEDLIIGFRVASLVSLPVSELTLNVDSLSGNTLYLTIEFIPSERTFHLRQSIDGETFVPFPLGWTSPTKAHSRLPSRWTELRAPPS